MTQAEYDAYQARRAASSAKPKQVVRNEPVAEAQREVQNTARTRVSVASYRRRLLDPDNLCPKYFIDGLRYVALIRDDSAQDITLEVSQVKVKTKAEERTEIELNSTGAVEMEESP